MDSLLQLAGEVHSLPETRYGLRIADRFYPSSHRHDFKFGFNNLEEFKELIVEEELFKEEEFCFFEIHDLLENKVYMYDRTHLDADKLQSLK